MHRGIGTMQLELKPHQQAIIDKDPKKLLLGLGTGSGKTLIALLLARGKTLVVCPKTQRDDKTWEENRDKFNIDIDLTVLSKEDFKKQCTSLPYFNTVICDEAHILTGVSADTRIERGVLKPKTSQIYQAFLSFIQKNPPDRLYLASATPAMKPMHVYAIATIFGHNWNYFAFRNKYYIARKQGYRDIWLPKKTKALEERLIELIKSFGETGDLENWYTVPEQKHETIYVDLTQEQIQAIKELHQSEADPMAIRTRTRSIENGILYTFESVAISEREAKFERCTRHYQNNKTQAIKEVLKNYKKAIIFVNYTGQIEKLKEELEKEGKQVVTLTGATKSEDRGKAIRFTEENDEAILIAQSSISAGWEVKSCRCMIFASKSFRYVDYKQALGRNLRLDNLDIAHNTYYHIVTKDGLDQQCHEAILRGDDFQEKIMQEYEA